MVAHQNSQLDCGQGISETRQAIPSVGCHDKMHVSGSGLGCLATGS